MYARHVLYQRYEILFHPDFYGIFLKNTIQWQITIQEETF